MVQQAHAGLAKLSGLTDDRATLDALRAEVAQKAPLPPEEHIEEQVEPEPVTAHPQEMAAVEPDPETIEEVPVTLEAAEPEIEPEIEVAPEPTFAAAASAHAPTHAPATLDEFVADLEASLPEDFMAPAATSMPPAHIVAPLAAPTPQTAFLSGAHSAAAAQPALQPAPVRVIPAAVVMAAPAAPAVPITAAQAEAGADLNDMFDELRAGLEDSSAPADEDPEDHYNLGVAFREMGLIDEAIGELQKVCQSIDRGQPFKYTMQAYTWLAQCFLDKGVPEASIRWYEKALKIRDIDEEAKTALHYELASAYEAAQNKRAALAHFMEVYGANIDYRDVGERIQALRS
jgi:TolA-binding protein